MKHRVLSPLLVIAFCSALVGGTNAAQAQGVIWKLPEEEGGWVRYEGTYEQVQFRPDSTEGDVRNSWIRHLTIKALGRETAEFRGESTPCRWIEIKVVTGIEKEGQLEPGPTGTKIYKVLIPESRVVGQVKDERGVLVSYLPIAKGYRKIGDGEVRQLKSGVLQIYPSISLLRHYRSLEETSDEAQPLTIGLGTIDARQLKGTFSMESSTIRSTNQAELWRSDEVPFGLAQWSVTLVQSRKDVSESRSNFEPAVEATEEMQALQAGTGAQSELVTP